MVKNPPANAGDIRGSGSIPGLGRSHMTSSNQAQALQLLRSVCCELRKEKKKNCAAHGVPHGTELLPKADTSLYIRQGSVAWGVNRFLLRENSFYVSKKCHEAAHKYFHRQHF